MELTLVLLGSFLLGLLGLGRNLSLGLLALPALLLPILALGPGSGGLDGRLLGLAAGLVVLIAGGALQRRLQLQHHLRPRPILKLGSVLLAGLVAYWSGFRISFITNPEGGFIYLSYLGLPLTLIWIWAVSSSLGFLRKLEGRRPSTFPLHLQIALIVALVILGIDLLLSRAQGPGARSALRFALALDLGLLGLLGGSLLCSRSHPHPRLRARAGRARAGGGYPELGFELGLEPEEVGFVLAGLSIAGLLKVSTALALLTPMLLGIPMMTTSLSIAYSCGRGGLGPLPSRLAALRERWRLSEAGMVLLTYLFSGYLSLSLGLVALSKLPRLQLALGLIGGLAGLIWLLEERARALAAGLRIGTAGERLWLLGVPLVRLRLGEVVDRIESALADHRSSSRSRSGSKLIVATPDTTAVMRAQRDPLLREAYRRAGLVTADGIGLVWASRLLGIGLGVGGPLPERVTGIDLVLELCRRARERGRGYKLFLLGGKPGVAEAAARRLAERFPGLRIAGCHHGYFADNDNDEVIREINAAEPEVLLVGLGVPRQELWMLENEEKLEAGVLIGVGGSFDVLSGRLRRAPRLLQRAGLEWLWRLLRQPWRLPRALAIPRFLLWVLLLKLTGPDQGQGESAPEGARLPLPE